MTFSSSPLLTGYALLGLKRYNLLLLHNMAWGTDRMAIATLARIKHLGRSMYVGQDLHDIDKPDDLKYLRI